jgi:hypothetical protein
MDTCSKQIRGLIGKLSYHQGQQEFYKGNCEYIPFDVKDGKVVTPPGKDIKITITYGVINAVCVKWENDSEHGYTVKELIDITENAYDSVYDEDLKIRDNKRIMLISGFLNVNPSKGKYGVFMPRNDIKIQGLYYSPERNEYFPRIDEISIIQR